MTTPPRPTFTSLDDDDRAHPGAPPSDPTPIDSRTDVDARPVPHVGSPPPRSMSAAAAGAATRLAGCPVEPTDATYNSMSLTSLILRGLERQSESRPPPPVPPLRAAGWELSAGAPSALRSWGGVDSNNARHRVSSHRASSPSAPMHISRERRHRLASTLRGVLQMIDDDDDLNEDNSANLFANEGVVDSHCYEGIGGGERCDDAGDFSTRQ